MCGIAGVFGGPERAATERMVAALGHRGPDDSGIFADGRAVLGHARLSILDLSAAGHQPMASPDGHVHIVFNGEMYNFREQRVRLEGRGYCFRSRSDTEVVLALYLEHGDDFVDHMRGMFAVAIYDRREGPGRERLVLARDHFGIKPLLYAETVGRFVFASELKALLVSGLVPADIDSVALQELLSKGSVAQPRTILAAVRALPPAHRMVIEGGRNRIERYWSLGRDRVSGLRHAAYPEMVEAVESALAESVSLQLVADVPVGAFLSGGIDSSLLVALMAERHSGPLRTFSVGFEGEGADIDESDDAALIAAHFGTEHRRVQVTGADALAAMGRIGAALDQPSVDGANAYFVSGAPGGDLKVAISGTGGDELFAGYPWFAAMHSFRGGPLRDAIAAFAGRKFFDPLARGRAGGAMRRLRRGDFQSAYAQQYQIFGPAHAPGMLSPEMRDAAGAAPPMVTPDELAAGTALERVSGLCLRGYTQNQLLRDIDAVSMAHSLEVRVPFLDHVLADIALSLPDAAKIGPCDSKAAAGSYASEGVKKVLLDIGRKFLPVEFETRPKRGFSLPFDSWLRGPLHELVHETLSPAVVKRRGLLCPERVHETVVGFDQGRISWSGPWLLMIIELWQQQLPRARAVNIPAQTVSVA